MKKSIKLILAVLALAIIVAFIGFKFVNKPVNDYAEKEVNANFHFAQIMDKVSNDTASLSELKDKLVGIDGDIKSIKNEANAITIELGDTNTMSSIICQIDTRYTKEFNQLKPGEHIALKGIITGYTIDTDLGFGNTVEMNYCTKNTK